ncbi:MAG: hypothetical protein ACPGVP_21460, partial [Thiolinea sp.]
MKTQFPSLCLASVILVMTAAGAVQADDSVSVDGLSNSLVTTDLTPEAILALEANAREGEHCESDDEGDEESDGEGDEESDGEGDEESDGEG